MLIYNVGVESNFFNIRNSNGDIMVRMFYSIVNLSLDRVKPKTIKLSFAAFLPFTT